MSRYRLTPEAVEDLTEIAEYISQDDPRAARAVLISLRKAMRKLARSPGIGHWREDLPSKDLRVWPVYSFLIVYRARIRPLQVLRVLSGWRHLPSALK